MTFRNNSDACRETRELLTEITTAGSLGDEAPLLAQARNHLRQCNDCQREVNEVKELLRVTRHALQELPVLDERERLKPLIDASKRRMLSLAVADQAGTLPVHDQVDWNILLELRPRELEAIIKRAIITSCVHFGLNLYGDIDYLWHSVVTKAGPKFKGLPSRMVVRESSKSYEIGDFVLAAFDIYVSILQGTIPDILISREAMGNFGLVIRDSLREQLEPIRGHSQNNSD